MSEHLAAELWGELKRFVNMPLRAIQISNVP